MNKRISYCLLLLGIFVAPFFAFAQAPSCVSIEGNIKYGLKDENSGGEVSTLQSFLNSGGFLNSSTTGYFGPLTLQAVKDFQNKNSLSADGVVGSATRGKIKSLTCSGDISMASSGASAISRGSNSVSSGASDPGSMSPSGAFKPSQLSARAGSCGVELSWTNVSVAIQYMIYRNESFMDAVKSLAWTDKEASPGGSYIYKIIAIDKENILDTISDSYGYSISNKESAVAQVSCAPSSVASSSATSTLSQASSPGQPQAAAVSPNSFSGCGTNTTGFSTITGISCVGNPAPHPPTDLMNAYWDGVKWAQDPNDSLYGFTTTQYLKAINTPGTPQFKAFVTPGYHFNGTAWVTNSFAPGYHFDYIKNDWIPDAGYHFDGNYWVKD